jgi:phage gpG-like protein
MFTVRIDTNKLSADLQRKLGAATRRKILVAMARRFREITVGTMGPEGTNRAANWGTLNKLYQKEVMRRAFNNSPVPTLLRSGTLRRSIGIGEASSDSVTITAASPYASEHQLGEGKPYRPFFPITMGGTLTQYAEHELLKVAEKELAQAISK